MFIHSIANLKNRSKEIFSLRSKKAPMIFFFHLYNTRSNYKLNNLKFLVSLFKNKNNFFHIDFINWLILQNIFYVKYFNLLSNIFFKKESNLNLIKLNLLFNFFILNTSIYCLKTFNLNVYSDWYTYSFNKKIIKKNFYNLKTSDLFKYIMAKRRLYLKKVYKIYHNQYKKINIKFKFINLIKLKSLVKINIIQAYRINMVDYLPVRFSESSVNKYIDYSNIKNYSFFFLRKNRIFNKSRYSRNRQLYRTGVY